MILAALGIVMLLARGGRNALAAPPGNGSPAPGFSLSALAGETVTLDSFRGRPVVLNFWATWCGACRREMPLLQQFSREHAGEVTILGIDLGENPTKVAAYAKNSGLTFPILLDPRGKVAESYGVLGLPVTLLVGADGRIAANVAMGALTREGLEALLKDIHPAPKPPPR